MTRPGPPLVDLDVRTYDRTVSMPQHGRAAGMPGPSVFRRVDPPQVVLVDLATLFPRAPHQRGRYQAGGLQMHAVVEGKLTCWGLCEQGHWWGLVTYPITFGSTTRSVTHWVPAWVLRARRS
jgi:hypothetical protein